MGGGGAGGGGGGSFHLPSEPPVAALLVRHLRKNCGCEILIEIDVHISKKIQIKVCFERRLMNAHNR